MLIINADKSLVPDSPCLTLFSPKEAVPSGLNMMHRVRGSLIEVVSFLSAASVVIHNKTKALRAPSQLSFSVLKIRA